MSKPEQSHMEAYLKYLRANVQLKEKHQEINNLRLEETVKTEGSLNVKDSLALEAEYLRSIYKVLPREQALQMTLKQAKNHTSIRP
ncbi:hypothetical protein [Endozoicomonas sp. ALD040]|uniref:hypothetical protein n=1 Tax=Endozoicomonas sp. ALD040 TaxID=3403079 RepID=UPI003BB1D252